MSTIAFTPLIIIPPIAATPWIIASAGIALLPLIFSPDVTTLYSHTASSSPKIDSFKKLEYIYQHFQDCEKIYESDPDAVRHETDNTLYPHINNDIKYGLFKDVINSYYLDSQIKDDFSCNQECYTDIQQTQQERQLTPCTHAYDHITQHINNLDDCTQQNTLHTMEEDASLFTSDTTTSCD